MHKLAPRADIKKELFKISAPAKKPAAKKESSSEEDSSDEEEKPKAKAGKKFSKLKTELYQNPLTAKIFTVFDHSLLESVTQRSMGWEVPRYLRIQVHKKVKEKITDYWR